VRRAMCSTPSTRSRLRWKFGTHCFLDRERPVDHRPALNPTSHAGEPEGRYGETLVAERATFHC
jgi:hypothetical protein